MLLIGASLSEPHIDEKYMRDSYIYIYSTSVTRAPPYTKHIGRMKYLAMKNPRQEKSIADHVDVCDRQASATQQTVVIMLSNEQTCSSSSFKIILYAGFSKINVTRESADEQSG